MAAIGCAVGLGNIWRFPYIAYKSGGGAFFLPYLMAIFLVGIPLMILEQGIGQMEQGSSPLTFYKIRKRWEWLGWWGVVFSSFGIACYYNVVLAWCANYLVYSFDLSWGSDPKDFFLNSFLRVSQSPFEFGKFRLEIVVSLVLMWGLTWWILRRGVSKGIEMATKIFMPILFVLMVVLVGWSLTLPGAEIGIRNYLTPDIDKIFDVEVWRNAFGQVFFTLSLGYGMMITYGGYLPKKSNITNNALIVVFSNSAFEIMAGFAVFSTIGFMALQTGLPFSETLTQGPGLSFMVYPQAINLLPAGKMLFGVFFFLSLILAGITSLVALMELFVSGAQDKFGWSRNAGATFSCVVACLLGLIFTTQAGLYWLDIVDHFINQFAVVIFALLETVLVAYFFGTEAFLNFINAESTTQVGWVWKFGLSIFTPTILVGMLAAGTWQDLTRSYEGYPWQANLSIGIGSMAVALFISYFLTKARWRENKECDKFL